MNMGKKKKGNLNKIGGFYWYQYPGSDIIIYIVLPNITIGGKCIKCIAVLAILFLTTASKSTIISTQISIKNGKSKGIKI